eukprot:11205609-Karenia_brevis.AAC.1
MEGQGRDAQLEHCERTWADGPDWERLLAVDRLLCQDVAQDGVSHLVGDEFVPCNISGVVDKL